jgi:hypothetical protein
MASITQLTARLIDLFGSPSTADPSKLKNNLTVTPSGNVAVGSGTDDGTANKLQLAGTLGINNTAANYRAANYYTSGSLRWASGVDATAESGSNAGSSWFMNRYSDTGVFIDSPLSISRKTGVVTANSGVQVTMNSSWTGDGYGQFRAVYGNYGVILRNDGTTCYLLSTASGSPYGTWNNYRPFQWNLSTGAVTIAADGTSTTFGGVAIGTQIQGTGSVGLVSGATGSGTSAIAINYAGQLATWNGSNGWNSFYNIITASGGTMQGTLNMYNQSTIQLTGSNGYFGLLRGDSSGIVGFINQANTAWNLRVYDAGTILARGVYQSNVGYQCQQGNGGAQGGNIFNMYWNGNVQMWIDTTNVGNISLSSDYRIKHSVEQTQGGLAKVNAVRTVSYRFKDIHLYKDDGRARDGFIAHEVAEVIPSAVYGEKDAVNAEGEIQPQTLDPMPMISVLWNAVQELSAQVQDLKAQLASKE